MRPWISIDVYKPAQHSEKCPRCHVDIRWETVAFSTPAAYWDARRRAISGHLCPTWAHLSEDAY